VELLEGHPNRPFVRFVGDVVTNGAALGAWAFDDSSVEIRPNLSSIRQLESEAGQATLAWLDLEHGLHRLRGPWSSPPHPHFQSWPVGAIQKRRDIPISVKARVITDYSAGGLLGLNAAIPADGKSVQYMTLAQPVAAALAYKRAGRDVWGFKADLRDAYRILQVRAEDLHLQGIHIRRDGRDVYYVDGHLGFGCASAPRIFDSFAAAIQWIYEQRLAAAGIDAHVYHLLDDSLTIAASLEDAQRAERVKDELFLELAIEEQEEKRCPPSQRFEFLGIVLDLRDGTLSLPESKRARLVAPLRTFAQVGHCQLRELESVVGLATFAGIVIPCHRPLLSSLIAAQAIARRRGGSGGRRTRFRRVTLATAAREDARDLADAFEAAPCLRWERLFDTPYTAETVWSIDAAGVAGCGGFSLARGEWFHAPWPIGWNQGEQGMSSALQELVAVAYLVERAEPDAQLVVWTDSLAARGALARARSPVPLVNTLLRSILLTCVRRKVFLTLAWHRRETSLSALAADQLSRGDLHAASQLVPALSATRRISASSAVTRICERVSRGTPLVA